MPACSVASLQPMDCSLPGLSVCGIFQARILEWVAIFYSRGYSRLRDRLAGRFFTTVTPGKPDYIRMLTFKKKSAYAFQKAANNTNLNTQCYVCLWSFPAPRVCSITTAIPGPPWGKCPQVPEDTVAYLISIPALSNVVSIIIFFSLTWRVHCLWVGSGSWWWTGKPGVLQSMGSQRVGHDWACELNWRVYCLEERD